MLNIQRFRCEGRERGCVTDERRPVFSFALESDRTDVALRSADARMRFKLCETAPYTRHIHRNRL